jgi:hypothetical protein
VHPAAYDLNGHPLEDRLSLDFSGGGYKALYTERGCSNVIRGFAGEEAACRFLADELMRYDGRYRPVIQLSVRRTCLRAHGLLDGSLS